MLAGPYLSGIQTNLLHFLNSFLDLSFAIQNGKSDSITLCFYGMMNSPMILYNIVTILILHVLVNTALTICCHILYYMYDTRHCIDMKYI